MLKRDKHHKKLNNKGMTLVEVIITITILVAVSGFILSAFVSSMRAAAKSRELHRATTVAQNLMEGVKLKSAEELAYQFNYPVLKDAADADVSNFSVYLPSMFQYGVDKSVGELYYAENPANPSGAKILTKVTPTTLANYEAAKVATPYDPEAVAKAASAYTLDLKTTNYDFLLDTAGTYTYYLRNLQNDGAYYNAKITLDASPYRTGGASNLNVNSEQLISVPTIDSTYDAVEVMGDTYDSSAIAELGVKYPGETITPADLERKITLTLDHNLMPSGYYRTIVTVVYEYRFRKSDLTMSDPYELKVSIPFNNTGDEDTKSLRNVYLYYYPLYKEGTNKDTICIKNPDNKDFNLYVIKQENTGISQSDLQIKENAYRMDFVVEETTESADGKSHISLFTNLNESLYSVYTSATIPPIQQATFKRKGVATFDGSMFRINDIRNMQASDRMYNVTIELFSSEKAENLTSFQAADVATWFDEDNRLITISSTISQ